MQKDKMGNAFDFRLFKRLLGFSKPYKSTFYGVFITAILLAASSALRPILLKETINNPILNKNAEGVVFYISLMLLVLLFEVIFQFLFIYFSNWLGQSIIKDIRVLLFQKMMRFKMQYFDTNPVGKLVTNAVSDIEKIADVFSQGFFLIIGDLLKMTVVMAVMLYTNVKLSLYVFILLPFIIIAIKVFQRAMKGAFKEVRKQVSVLNTFVQERVTGMKIVQLFVQEKSEYNQFVNINTKHKKAWIKTVWYNSIFFPIIELAASITIAIIIWNSAMETTLHNEAANLGVIAMFVQMTNMLFRPLRQLADKFNTLQMGMVAANRVFDVLDTQAEIEDKGTIEGKKIKGNISFKNVYFSYVEGEEVLKGVSFDAKQGETIAIVGATGAGKSTIVNLLNRFYEIDKGNIILDDVSIANYKLNNLRSKIAVVLQDVFLFADSIFNNITLYNKNITLKEVTAAAKEIGVHEFIMKLPNNYYYNVKERGVMLSSGQRQLLAFLRAYVSNPTILILDEATSSIDSYSEQLIQKAIHKITQNRTSIVIAHRLATIKSADIILVMDKGNIVERGTHKELLTIKNGYYRKLYEVQFLEN